MKQIIYVSLLCLCILGIMACGGDEQASAPPPDPGRPPDMGIDPVAIEELIKKQVGQAKSDLRSIATGLEAYYVDNNTYPEKISALTTPIAYLTRSLKDPFKPDAEFRYQKIGENDWILWSIGPDKKDDGAQILYDEKAGVSSPGDIVRKKM
jgi:hypothetical protein